MKSNYQLKSLFLERMKLLLPEQKDFQSYLEIVKNEPAKSIRCNTLKISPEELKKQLEKKGWLIKQPWEDYPEVMIVEGKYVRSRSQINKEDINNKNKNVKPTSKNFSPLNKISAEHHDESLMRSNKRGEAEPKLIDLEPGELGRSLEHLLGYYYIQELASMLPIIALKPQPRELFLDLCASPGSKTTQVAASMKNTGTIIANEISLRRIQILASNLERCGVTNVIITKKEGTALCKKFKSLGIKFDKILVDAPCSGEGTLRSTPKTAIMWNPNTIKQLSKIQKQLLKEAFEILKPNGEIVYSTCTHAPEENEKVIDFAIRELKAKIEKPLIPKEIKCREGITRWQDSNYDDKVKNTCRIYPQDANTEGFFIARLRK